jgi:hypothetical protein
MYFQLKRPYFKTKRIALREAELLLKCDDPSNVFDEIYNPDNLANSCRDEKQLENLKGNAKKKATGEVHRANLADGVIEVLKKLTGHKYMKTIVFTDAHQHPMIMLYDEDMYVFFLINSRNMYI